MDREMHVRLDDAAAEAVVELRARGINPSQVVREALCAARSRAHLRAAVLDECRRIAADPVEREEMLIIREQMRELMPIEGEE